MIDNTQEQYQHKKKQVLLKHLKVIEKQEKKLFEGKENNLLMSKINPVLAKVQDKVPETLKATLDKAFYKGFRLVFDKGSTYIEKTYQKDKLKLEYDLNNYAVEKYASRKLIKRLDKQSNRSNLINSSIAVIEGGALGFLGIGLPDIPLFIAVILRNLNEIALSYGFDYETPEEKNYQLTLICGALTKAEAQIRYSEEADSLGAKLDSGIVSKAEDWDYVRETADLLSDTLLTAKFLQGIPLVGLIGGAVNHTVITKINRYARVKYKKRYLQNKVNTL